MIGFGVVSRDQISLDRLGALRKGSVSYTILNQFGPDLSEEEETIIDAIYCSLPGSPFNLKKTWRNRYQRIDEYLLEEIRNNFPGDAVLHVHDMAASNAITSLELYDALKSIGRVELHASDYYDVVHVVTLPSSRWSVVFDAEYNPLQFVGKRMVVPADNRTLRAGFPLNLAIKKMLRALLLPKARRILERTSAAQAKGVSQIVLFHPRCVAAARDDRRFTLGRHNIFDTEARSYEVVRLMSTIKSIRDSDKITALFRSVSQSVAEGGLFVAGQSRDLNRPAFIPTTIFRRRGNRYRALRDIMGGHDCRELVLGLDLPERAIRS